MFKADPVKKIEKIISKTLKIFNKEIANSKFYLGRYVIRECFKKISVTDTNHYAISYCFECVDKETNKKGFYAYSKVNESDCVDTESFTRHLHSILSAFSGKAPEHKKDEKGKKVDYRKIKID